MSNDKNNINDHFPGTELIRENEELDPGERRRWFREAQFGMMIHWGLYSLLAGEYRGQRSTRTAEWIQSNFRIPNAEYEQLAKQYELDLEKIKGMVPAEEIKAGIETRKAIKVIVDAAVAVAPKAEEKAE